MEAWNRLLTSARVEPADLFRQILTEVLDDLMDQVSGPSRTEKVKHSLRSISQMYKGGLSRASSQYRPDWSDSANRCAYVFLYLMQQCHLVYSSLQRESNDIIAAWRNMSNMKVCSIGGGPGSDLVGVTTFLREYGIFPPSLECLVLDLYPNWKDTWDTIHQCIPEHFRVKYERCDVVTDVGLPSNAHQFIQQADLITLVKFFSVVSAFFRTNHGRSQGNFLRSILREIKPGCFVLYIDNVHDSDTQFESEFASQVGLQMVSEFRGCPTLPFGQYSLTVKNYCRDLDFNPMRSCNVIIQLYKKKAVQPFSRLVTTFDWINSGSGRSDNINRPGSLQPRLSFCPSTEGVPMSVPASQFARPALFGWTTRSNQTERKSTPSVNPYDNQQRVPTVVRGTNVLAPPSGFPHFSVQQQTGLYTSQVRSSVGSRLACTFSSPIITTHRHASTTHHAIGPVTQVRATIPPTSTTLDHGYLKMGLHASPVLNQVPASRIHPRITSTAVYSTATMYSPVKLTQTPAASCRAQPTDQGYAKMDQHAFRVQNRVLASTPDLRTTPTPLSSVATTSSPIKFTLKPATSFRAPPTDCSYPKVGQRANLVLKQVPASTSNSRPTSTSVHSSVTINSPVKFAQVKAPKQNSTPRPLNLNPFERYTKHKYQVPTSPEHKPVLMPDETEVRGKQREQGCDRRAQRAGTNSLFSPLPSQQLTYPFLKETNASISPGSMHITSMGSTTSSCLTRGLPVDKTTGGSVPYIKRVSTVQNQSDNSISHPQTLTIGPNTSTLSRASRSSLTEKYLSAWGPDPIRSSQSRNSTLTKTSSSTKESTDSKPHTDTFLSKQTSQRLCLQDIASNESENTNHKYTSPSELSSTQRSKSIRSTGSERHEHLKYKGAPNTSRFESAISRCSEATGTKTKSASSPEQNLPQRGYITGNRQSDAFTATSRVSTLSSDETLGCSSYIKPRARGSGLTASPPYSHARHNEVGPSYRNVLQSYPWPRHFHSTSSSDSSSDD